MKNYHDIVGQYPESTVIEFKGLAITYETKINQENKTVDYEVVSVRILNQKQVIVGLRNKDGIWNTLLGVVVNKNRILAKEIGELSQALNGENLTTTEMELPLKPQAPIR